MRPHDAGHDNLTPPGRRHGARFLDGCAGRRPQDMASAGLCPSCPLFVSPVSCMYPPGFTMTGGAGGVLGLRPRAFFQIVGDVSVWHRIGTGSRGAPKCPLHVTPSMYPLHAPPMHPPCTPHAPLACTPLHVSPCMYPAVTFCMNP